MKYHFDVSKDFPRFLLLLTLVCILSSCNANATPAVSVQTSNSTNAVTSITFTNTPLPLTADPNLTQIAQVIATQNLIHTTPTNPGQVATLATAASQTSSISDTPTTILNTLSPATPLPALSMFAQSQPVTATVTARLINQLDFGNAGQVLALALSPDGKLLALSSKNQIWLWESATGKMVQTIYVTAANTDEKGAASLSWSPDGKQFAAGGLHGTVMLWQLNQTTERLRNGPVHLEPDQDAATLGDEVMVGFSPDSQSLAAIDSKGTIVAWDSQTLLLKMLFDTSYAGHISWNPNSKSLTDEFLEVGYLNDANIYIPGEEARVDSTTPYDVAWSPDGKHIALSSQDFDLMLANAPEANSKSGITKLGSGIQAAKNGINNTKLRPMAWSPNSQLIAIGNLQIPGQISIIRPEDLKVILTIDASQQALTSLQWAANALLITGGTDGVVKFWQLK